MFNMMIAGVNEFITDPVSGTLIPNPAYYDVSGGGSAGGILNPIEGISKYFSEMTKMIVQNIKQGLINASNSTMSKMFNDMNAQIEWASGELSKSPQEWSGGIFEKIMEISKAVIVPIAGIIITLVLCYELITLLTEYNNMNQVTPTKIIMIIIKTSIAVLVLSNAFIIVNNFFKLGNDVLINSAKLVTSSVKISNPTLPLNLDMEVGYLLSVLLLLLIARGISLIITIFILIAIYLWFIEIYIYASAAAIPFATFLNKEWGQIGNNYIKKILALSFQAFFMLLCFSIYSAIATSISSDNGDIVMNIIKTIAVGGVLVITLFKSGSIASSIFGAH